MSRAIPMSTLCLLAIGAIGALPSPRLLAQVQRPARVLDVDVAVTYVGERAKVAAVDCGCFWLQGGSGNVAATFFHGLGVAADLTGVHASNITDGVGLDKITIAVGPRYTYKPQGWSNHLSGRREFSVFGEGLFGSTHGFNGVFPASSGTKAADSSFAVELGGGLNLSISHTIGIRVLEVDYLRSTLPNGGNDTQNDLRFGAGLDLHFHSPIRK